MSQGDVFGWEFIASPAEGDQQFYCRLAFRSYAVVKRVKWQFSTSLTGPVCCSQRRLINVSGDGTKDSSTFHEVWEAAELFVVVRLSIKFASAIYAPEIPVGTQPHISPKPRDSDF